MIVLLACAQPDSDSAPRKKEELEAPSSLTISTYDATSDEDGFVQVPVEITEGVGAFQVVVKRDNNYVSTDYIYGPGDRLLLDWEDWYDSSFSLTECFFPSEFATTANWPIREQDGPLTEGTYTVWVSTLSASGNYTGNKDVEVEVLTRVDDDFEEGDLRVLIAYARGVRDEEGVVDAVEAAVESWVEIYAAEGIALTTEDTDIDVDAALPDTYEGLDAIRELYEAQDQRVVLLVVGEDIAGDPYTYGEAGGIPGPYSAANHAAVEISWLAGAGADGQFSNADILLMAETMGHEVGHYLGLFHPVEDGFEYWDAIDDTEACRAVSSCESSLGTNLMYPYPLCTGMATNTCARQGQVTAEQAGVLHRYVGVE